MWGEWGSWSGCDFTCKSANNDGDGKRARYRPCNNPDPKYGGYDCLYTSCCEYDLTPCEPLPECGHGKCFESDIFTTFLKV